MGGVSGIYFGLGILDSSHLWFLSFLFPLPLIYLGAIDGLLNLTSYNGLLYFQEEKECSLSDWSEASVADKGKPAGMRGRKAIGSQGLVSVGGREVRTASCRSVQGKTCLA